jgi:diguanylate cyclase (GGDEF)-like protein
MVLDFTSLLLATGISAVWLSLTLLAFWITARHESFLVTWAAGLMVLAAHVFCYWMHVEAPSTYWCLMLVALLPIGAAIVHAAAYQFVDGTAPLPSILRWSAASLALTQPPVLLGYDGIGLIAQSALAAWLFARTGLVYWRARKEAPVNIPVLTLLYALLGTSFGMCALAIVLDGQWSIGHAPDNWAERINIVVSVMCMTGLGAMSISLNQSRQAKRHRADALADPLTGLLNRRGLFSLHGERSFGRFMAVAMFDLDHFKKINDTHGHGVGDEVIRRFASALSRHSRPRDDAVRLGREEFALIMPRVTRDQALKVVERISVAFAADTLPVGAEIVRCTVSAGIAFGSPQGRRVEDLIELADQALYAAKRDGRNCIRLNADMLRLAS